ncbi:flavin reductase [Arenibacter sp. GZD96]|uniref:flavin reductase family protein n=1 Tax=Aurantibrevibacter litoralis TaxID=3106030 RepID=UPI002AFFAB48|nr:flavin reductase [Arenibacter sp. GZD-96]MEA1785177.1 flavin reductase [Arenibacter sp. GZD-96]
MKFTQQDIANLDRNKRIVLINAVAGIRPANLIGSVSRSGLSNVAIFNSVMHLGSDPALLGFIMRPVETVARHTYENILETEKYTINQVHTAIIKKAHYTSAKVDRGTSEFTACGLTETYIKNFKAPFVKESRLKIGLQFIEALKIKQNNTLLIIGEIVYLEMPDTAFDDEDDLNLATLSSVGVSGLNTYYEVKKLARFPYARPNELPDFTKH